MTTFLDAVQALLQPLAPGSAWYGINTTQPLAADANGLKPFIVWQRVVSADNVNFNGPSSGQFTRIQVDIFAPRIQAAEAIRMDVDAALLGALSTTPLTAQDIYEEPVRLWRISRDYSIWYDESQS